MTKRALLIGINRYRIPGADLRGCLNDVQQMRDVLTELYDFSERDITVLTDLDATKSAMQKGLESLLRGARAGDVLLAHYSGHGSNVPDKNGDEADFRDEILCPTDLDWKDPLLDDWLRTLFDTLPEGTNLTVIMDCCHSGTNTRAIVPVDSKDPIQRFLPCPLDLLAVESGRELRGALRGVGKTRSAALPRTDIKDVPLPETLITACRDDQTSADAYINSDYHGAMTYSLVSAIRKARGKITYRDLHAQTSQQTQSYSQVPQLEGRASTFDRQFLSPP